jgi:hypothetical protein
MRTKTLFIAGVMLALSLAISQAQNIYSANVVGYINQVIQPGLQCIANPLDNASTNGVNEVMPNLPDGSYVYAYNITSNAFIPYVVYSGVYYNPNTFAVLPNPTAAPGTGFFVYNAGSVYTNSWQGLIDCPYGGSTNVVLTNTLSMYGPVVPYTGDIYTILGFCPPDGSYVYIFDPIAQAFDISVVYSCVYYNPNTFAVNPDPQVTLGQGFFLYCPTVGTWTQTFNY